MQSSWKGVSIRGWLALWIVGSGLSFLYITTWLAMALLGVEQGMQIALMTIGLVGTAIGGATGFYFGQKSAESQGTEINADGQELNVDVNIPEI